MSTVAHVVCMAKNGVIGDSNTNGIPWHHKEDFQYFKQLTMHSSVIMGSKTWDSLPKKPLPGRVNIILTNQRNFIKTDEVTRIFSNADYAIRFGKAKLSIIGDTPDSITSLTGNVMIIGGAQVYNSTISMVDTVFLNVLDNEYPGDVFYPCLEELERDFELMSTERFVADDGEKRIYQRKLV